MKTIFKKRQTVWSSEFGKGKVVSVNKNPEDQYPIEVEFDDCKGESISYTANGIYDVYKDYSPSLFAHDPLNNELPVINLSKSKEMECALNSSFNKTTECNIIAKIITNEKTVYYLTEDVMTLTGKVIYEHVREITPKVVELTMSDIILLLEEYKEYIIKEAFNI